jgi:hypothetical protein
MKNLAFLVLTFSLVFTGCSKSEYELDKSVYIPDPDYPELPAYTEWGYNTFGAYYERKLFVYTDNEVPAKVINRGGVTRFSLNGILSEMNDHYYYDNSHYGTPMMLNMELPGFNPQVYSDLIQLNDTIYDLTDSAVKLIIGTDTTDLQILQGSLQFQRVQNLIVDKTPKLVVLSGHFGLQALINDNPISISYGRFDVGIDEYDFIKY